MRKGILAFLVLALAASAVYASGMIIKRRIPAAPPFSVSDNFNRTNEDPIVTNWTALSGSSLYAPRLYTNQAGSNWSGPGFAYWDNGSFANNQYSQATFNPSTRTYGWCGPVVRGSASGGYWLVHNVNYLAIYKITPNTSPGYELLAQSSQATPYIGDVLRLEVNGQVVTGYNVTRGVSVTITDSTITSGAAGYGAEGNDRWVDDWSGGDL